MDWNEAWAELGLSEGAPPAEVRRAYLRLLKTRKPEIDPAGFQRLRAAYETLSTRAPRPPAPTSVDPPPSTSSPSVRAPVSPLPRRSAHPVAARSGFVVAGDLRSVAHDLAARYDLAARDASVSAPSAQMGFDTLLRLVAADDVSTARTLHARIDAFGALHGPVRAFGPHALHVAMAGELLALAEALDDVERRALAEALRAGDYADDAPALLIVKVSASKARRLAALLRQRAPILEPLASALDTPHAGPVRDRGRSPLAFFMYPVALTLLGLVRACTSSCGAEDTPPAPLVAPSPWPHAELAKDASAPQAADLAPPPLRYATARASRLASAASAEKHDALSVDAAAVKAALAAGRCDVAKKIMSAVDERVRTTHVGADLVDEARGLSSAVEDGCAVFEADGGPT